MDAGWFVCLEILLSFISGTQLSYLETVWWFEIILLRFIRWGRSSVQSRANACVHAKLLQSCLTLFDPRHCSLPGSSIFGDSPGKNTGVCCHTLLQRIFLTLGSNPPLLHLLHWQAGSLPLTLPRKAPRTNDSLKGKTCLCILSNALLIMTFSNLVVGTGMFLVWCECWALLPTTLSGNSFSVLD